MHDWHEGVVPAIIAIGLSSVIHKGKTKLGEINAAIQGFEYCTADRRNRYGRVITKTQLKKAQYLELSKYGVSLDFGSITVYWVNRISI